MAQVHYGRGYVYSLQYHIVWCVKYRRKILTGDINTTLLDIISQVADTYGFTIEEANTDLDHVHLLVSASPQHSIPTIIKQLKGITARKLFTAYPELKQQLWGGHLWNPSYFIATVSETTEQDIRRYIQNQGKKQPSHA